MAIMRFYQTGCSDPSNDNGYVDVLIQAAGLMKAKFNLRQHLIEGNRMDLYNELCRNLKGSSIRSNDIIYSSIQSK